MSETKTIEDINGACRDTSAAVLTEAEIRERLAAGALPGSFDLDVAVASFACAMRGSAAMILVPVAGRGVFTRAKRIWLNGVEAYPGPAPNERLGVVDALVFADQTADGDSADDPAGARLLLAILEGERIAVECLSEEGRTFRNTFTKADLEYARMVTYNTFLPARMAPALAGMLGAGSKILVNRSPGLIIGAGTRNGPGKPSLSLSADMLEMDPACIGRAGPLTMSVTVPIPVTNMEANAAVCAMAWPGPQDRAPAPAAQEDQDTALYVKRIILGGNFALTDSSLSIVGAQ